MKIKSYILLFLILLFASKLSWAQDKYSVNINYFTTEDGLSHLDVNCFEKDSKGVLWVGTRDGLNRFDGQKFKVFTKKEGLNHKSINKLYRDKDVLWCIHHDRTTNTQLLSIFHTNEEKVYSLREYLGENIPFWQSDIESITRVGKVLIIIAKGEHYSYNSENGLEHLNFLHEGEEIKGVSKNGDFWLINWNKSYLSLRKVNKDGKEILYLERQELAFLPVAFIHQKDKKTYFAYDNKASEEYFWLILDEKDASMSIEKAFFYSDKKKVGINNYFCQYSPQLNAYWYIVRSTCLLLDAENNILYKAGTKLKLKNSDYSLIDGNSIWLAHQNNGFIRLELQKKRFKNIVVKGLSGFCSITKIKNTLYANSYDTLLVQNEDGFKKYSSLNPAIFKTKENNLWTFRYEILKKYNAKYQEIASFDIKDNQWLSVWSIYEDKNGLIWYSDMGLKSFNPKTQELKKVISNQFPEIEKGIVYYFYKKEDGNILLCTTTGLYEMQLGKGIIARYWSGGKGKYYLPADDFRHLYFDKANQSYWLTTNETGLIHWKTQNTLQNTQGNNSKSYTFNHSGANIIHAVYADDFGFLWLSTENGIIQFEKKTGDFKVYLPKDGTSTHEFNRISHFEDEEGKIYFGGIKGITTFEPKDFYQDFKSLENTKIIPIEISQYKEEDKKIQNVTAAYYQQKELNFYPNDRFLTFTFALNEYRYSKDVVYYYKLKGIDADWITTKNNEITISGMPYGKQILEVKALLLNGKFTKEHLEISIIIHKPFYLEWWFFVFSFFGIIGITLFYIRYRTQKLELQKINLENEVKKRTLKIEKDKEIIEKQTEKLIALDKTKTRFFANVSHELRTPITLIKAPIQSLIKKEKLSQEGKYLLQKAAENTNNLLNLVNEILDLTKLDNQKLALKEEKVLFYTFLRQLVSNFQSIAQMQDIEITLEYQTQKELQILLDKNKCQKIINNLLSNALKFTPEKGKINIIVNDLGEKILLKVADTGRGIPPEDIPHVFERYFQSSQNNKAEGGLGIGLALSMELVKLCKGKMWLESSTKSQNQGTTFFVEFPKREVLSILSTQDVLDIERGSTIPKSIETDNKSNFSNTKTAKTILIVEDNSDLRNYLAFILAKDYKVLTAENGKKAIDIISDGEVPNLVISDLMMPVMDGYEFLTTFKNNAHWTGIPFIMLTARAAQQDKLKALRIGVDDYIIKPFEEEELLVRVANLLENYVERLHFVQSQEQNLQNSENTLEKITKISVSTTDKEWLQNFENLIITNLDNSLFSVEYLAELCKISRTTLYKKIKTLTGLSPNQYIKAIRLQLAKDFLEHKKYKTLKEVSNQVGFKNTTHFGNLFQQEYGKSPSDFFA